MRAQRLNERTADGKIKRSNDGLLSRLLIVNEAIHCQLQIKA
jgi:hypothetical protein